MACMHLLHNGLRCNRPKGGGVGPCSSVQWEEFFVLWIEVGVGDLCERSISAGIGANRLSKEPTWAVAFYLIYTEAAAAAAGLPFLVGRDIVCIQVLLRHAKGPSQVFLRE